MVQQEQHTFLSKWAENKNLLNTNKHQKVKFQFFEFENENNMPSKDDIFHANRQFPV